MKFMLIYFKSKYTLTHTCVGKLISPLQNDEPPPNYNNIYFTL